MAGELVIFRHIAVDLTLRSLQVGRGTDGQLQGSVAQGRARGKQAGGAGLEGANLIGSRAGRGNFERRDAVLTAELRKIGASGID